MATLHRLRDAAIARVAPLTRASSDRDSDVVLIIQPDHLGDILLSQPAVQMIRRRNPHSRLVGFVGPWSEPIARATWDVDELLTFPFPAYDRSRSSTNPLEPYLLLRNAAEVAGSVRPGRVFVLRPDDWWSAWLASIIASGPIITARDPRMEPFNSVQVDLSAHEHAVERAVAIASHPDAGTADPDAAPLSIPVVAAAQEQARRTLHDAGVEGPFIVVHPGAGADVKTWPIRRWRTVVDHLTHTGHTVVITGSPDEQGPAEELAAANNRSVCLAGQTGLTELVEVLRTAILVVGPDSGPLHFAVACETPTVHLFGPSDHKKFGPWGPRDRHEVVTAGWQCARCGDLNPSRPAGCGCMLAIETEQVIRAIEEMLDRHATD